MSQLAAAEPWLIRELIECIKANDDLRRIYMTDVRFHNLVEVGKRLSSDQQLGLSRADVTFLRYEAQAARDLHGPLIAESFDFDGLADRIEALLPEKKSD